MVRSAASPVQSNLLDSGLRWVWGPDITIWGEKQQMGCWAPGVQEEKVQSSCKNPEPTWEVKQANNRWDLVHGHFICSQLSTRYSWGGDCHSNGIWGAKGLSMATEKSFCCAVWGIFSELFVFSIFLPLLYKSFSTGTTNPSTVLSQFWKMETHLHVLSQDAWTRNKAFTQLIQTPGCCIQGTLWAVKGTMNQVQRVIAGFIIPEGKCISKPEVRN